MPLLVILQKTNCNNKLYGRGASSSSASGKAQLQLIYKLIVIVPFIGYFTKHFFMLILPSINSTIFKFSH